MRMAGENEPLLDDDAISVSTVTTLADDENYQSILQAIRHVKERVWVVAVHTFIACLGSILIGMVLGFPSTISLELDDIYEDDPTHGIDDKSTQASLFGGFGALGALLGGPIAWPLSDCLGRKPALMLGGVPSLTGWLMITFAHFTETWSGFLALIYLGRIFTGIGAGWLVFCVSVYITEISSENLRGFSDACNQLFITIGIFLAYILGTFTITYDNFKYYHVALIGAAIVAIFEFLMIFTKETPRWLLAHHKDGSSVLRTLRGPDADIQQEVQSIMDGIGEEQGQSIKEVFAQFLNRSVYHPFILIIFFMFFQQFGGINAAIFYSGSILEQAGLGSARHAAITASIVVGVVQIIATFISVLLIDLLGRKILLVTASIGMCISSLLLGAHFYILNDVCHGCFGINCTNSNGTTNDFAPCDSTHIGWLAIVSVTVFIAAFSLAWGPIPWLSMPELLPLRARGAAAGIATFANWTFASIVGFAYHDYAKKLTPKCAWWSFALVMFTSTFFVIFFLPETKDHSLEEIEEHFEEGHIFAFTCGRTGRNKIDTVQPTVQA